MSDEEYELKNQTCGGLLLQFKRPIVYDLTIPDAFHIKNLVAISGRLISGEEINPESVTCITSNPHYVDSQRLKKEYLSSFSPRISEGLMKILYDSREEDSFLARYMRYKDHILANEWHIGKGTWYRFREGKREQVEKEVRAYFNELELTDFEKVGSLFQPYIERVGAPHKCN